jgi:G3E family GTPase
VCAHERADPRAVVGINLGQVDEQVAVSGTNQLLELSLECLCCTASHERLAR